MKRLIVLLIAIITLAFQSTLASVIKEQQVEFQGKSFPVSDLKKRIAKQKGLELKPVEPDTLSATIYKPEQGKKLPAIIMVHDCRGIQSYQRDWAKLVASWGYVVFFMDGFTSRNIESTCEGLGEMENYLIHGGRVQDVFAAHDYLKKQDYVENFRIGLMGWDYHSVLGAVAKHGMQQKFDARFMGAVAIYPSCNATSGTDFISPILVLIGEQDDWTPAEECRIMERYARAGLESVQLKYYKNAKHGFDDPALTQETYFPSYRNYFKSPAVGVTMQYNKQAHENSKVIIRQFLDFNIKYRPIQITLDDLPKQFSDEQISNADWVNQPDDHGSDIPSKGYSLFDRLFVRHENGKWLHDIPFPFDKLLTKLKAHVDNPNAKSTKLKSVLIPSGRSLVRNAAAPDFFEFPRIVVAVDTEPPLITDQYALLLKDRLYIAYQEKAQALEVISYNESEQRFEFQIVKNYIDNQQPIVQYANRSLCLSCHQNHAPIFANAPWDETNFNEQVFSKIKSKRENFFGLIPAVPVASSANSIDRSTNRATLLPIFNALWIDGCKAGTAQKSAGCRAQIFKSMLQYRLSNKSGFTRNALNYKTNFIQFTTQAWLSNWPNGLAIPMANITDRNPFTEKMEVSARFDPLTPRPPQTIWNSSNLSNMEQVIAGLADQIFKSDIKFLDTKLENPDSQGSNLTHYTNDCVISKTKYQAEKYYASIDCKDRNRTEENNFGLSGKLIIDLKSNLASGEFKSIKRTDEFILYDIRFNDAPLQFDSNVITLELSVSHRKSDLSVRLPSGNSLKGFKLELKTESINANKDKVLADLSFIESGDFLNIETTINSMLDENHKGQSDLFSSQPFNPSRYMSGLFDAMGYENYVKSCCQNNPEGLEKTAFSHDTINPKNEKDLERANTHDLITAACSKCHRNTEAFPPNFLSGNEEQIQRKLKQCASRIAYRLHMWHTPKNSRKKSPMPPTAPVLGQVKFNDEQWVDSSVLKRIKTHVLTLIDSPFRKNELLEQLLKTPYEKLDACNKSTLENL